MTTHDYEVLGADPAKVAGAIRNIPGLAALLDLPTLRAMAGWAQHNQDRDLYEKCHQAFAVGFYVPEPCSVHGTADWRTCPGCTDRAYVLDLPDGRPGVAPVSDDPRADPWVLLPVTLLQYIDQDSIRSAGDQDAARAYNDPLDEALVAAGFTDHGERPTT